MSAKKLSRREFLRLSALTAAGTALAGCAAPKTPAPPAEAPTQAPVEAPTQAPAAPAQVILEIGASNPEYENAERQIWDIYEAENPNVVVKLWSTNEDTEVAFQAKVAGGYTPAFGPSYAFIPSDINASNQERFVDLSTINFSWWDRLQQDPLHVVPEMYDMPVRAIEVFAGFLFTWMYHEDLMEKAGLNPRQDVKTWDDLKDFLQAGTEWANSTGEVDFFWDQGWHTWVFGKCYARVIPLAFPDGQQADQYKCWTGEMAFNDPASPYRHTFEFFKEAYDNGWMPENWWTREWETDMEASYIAKKSVMMLHGPWPWDKMLASDPTAKQFGFPATPPAAGQSPWMQFMYETSYLSGYTILAAARDLPEWPEIEKAFDWYFSPPIVKMRAEVLGLDVVYDLDEPLDLQGPQWLGVVKDIATPGGLWEDAEYTKEMWGDVAVAGKYKPGTPDAFDWVSGAFIQQWEGLMTGKESVQDVLDWVQANFEASYDL